MKIKFLEWDSLFFNKKIGQLEINKIGLNDSSYEEYDLLYVKLSQDKDLKIKGFINSHTETKVIFYKDNLNPKKKKSNIKSALDLVVDKKSIYELAYLSGIYSRFNLDRNFTKKDFKRLYKKWVDNSFEKSFADDVLVYFDEKQIVGFVTYKEFEYYATIGLIAVNENERGRGIGIELIESVESAIYKKGIFELRIPTQLENKQACSFYINKGYKIKNRKILKHFWKV